MKKLFLDANILFTATHNPDGKAAFIIALGAKGYWNLFTSSFAREEARRNLLLKFPANMPRFTQIIKDINIAAEVIDTPCPDILPVKDRPIFQAAIGCGATHLITGDIAHFGPLMKHARKTFGVQVITPSDFLSSL